MYSDNKTCATKSRKHEKRKKRKFLSGRPALWDIHSSQVPTMRIIVICFNNAMWIKAKIVKETNILRARKVDSGPSENGEIQEKECTVTTKHVSRNHANMKNKKNENS